MLLRFRVANHRSLRDEQTLSFVAAPRRGEQKRKGAVIPRTVSAAGIYGANASGKSNVLDALRWMSRAVKSSHTTWAPSGGVPRRPFLLDETGRKTPSFYEVDFLDEGVRYSYGFEIDDENVRGEWLYSFPAGRPRTLFERNGPEDYRFGRSLGGETARIAKLTRGNALYLSSAASNNHPLLGALYETLAEKVHFAEQDHFDEQARLSATMSLLEHPRAARDVNELLRLADLGLESAEVVRREIPPEVLTSFRRLREAVRESGGDFATDEEQFGKEIRLRRAGTDVTLDIREESAGTRVWLSMLGYTLVTLLAGHLLVVDEIDSSLHPVLSSTLIRMFQDPEINRTGAQLLFASHDTTLLGTMLADDTLGRDEVWFTEKDANGATSLFPLADFRPRTDENIERGYLQGRYGAVPYLNFDKVREIFRGMEPRLDEPSA
ncbi:ATP-binding protein [Microbispora hainanensis]|uniref:AAA family ATPase n=1 Tax=Microbispora TaxID=2005 RepID=UPI00115B44AC|nr:MULTISPECIES: ATP-binding protein [Microbispora]NJP23790.1 ATP-binding protein [Microbispora sp. CL1-1]TQS15324.1 ATP-binding protein [Microbispora sp. SCL1-1]